MRNAPLFPALATGIEEMSLATFGWLLGVSGLVGVVGSLHAIVLALLLIVPLPAITLAEIIVNPRSHNLLPFELLLWIILFFVCMAGLSVGRILRWGITKSIEVARM